MSFSKQNSETCLTCFFYIPNVFFFISAGISADVQVNLDAVQELFDKDKKEAKEFKAIVGKSPKALDQSLMDELNRYKEAHKVASESNQTLHKAMQVHLTNLKTLTKPLSELQKDIPSTADLDPESEANIAEFQRIIGKDQNKENMH